MCVCFLIYFVSTVKTLSLPTSSGGDRRRGQRVLGRDLYFVDAVVYFFCIFFLFYLGVISFSAFVVLYSMVQIESCFNSRHLRHDLVFAAQQYNSGTFLFFVLILYDYSFCLFVLIYKYIHGYVNFIGTLR